MFRSKSLRFRIVAFCFLIGVFVASIVQFNSTAVLVAIGTTLSLVIATKKSTQFLFFVALIMFVGVYRTQIFFPNQDAIGGKKAIQGYVTAEPDVRLDGVRYIVKTMSHGRIYVKSHLYPRYSYGDILSIDCSLKRPEPIEDFRYDMYLARYRVFWICRAPRISKQGAGEGSHMLQYIYRLKESVARKVNLLWHEPHASFMAGLLYGYRGGLGSLNELFSRTGVTHIVAISGYNITIISLIFSTILIHLCVPRKKAFYITVTGIALFVIFAGLSASVVRAGIMGSIVLLAKHLGRGSGVANVMLLSAVIMTIANPLVLTWDAGFQLSFLSTIGLVYVSPLLSSFTKRIPETLGLKESVDATLSATIATLPLILYQFGRLSIVALPVNVLILWIIPLLMAIGFFAVVFSYLFLPLASLLSWVAWIGLSYIIFVVKWFAALPFAAVDIVVPLWIALTMYAALFILVKRHRV